MDQYGYLITSDGEVFPSHLRSTDPLGLGGCVWVKLKGLHLEVKGCPKKPQHPSRDVCEKLPKINNKKTNITTTKMKISAGMTGFEEDILGVQEFNPPPQKRHEYIHTKSLE